MTTFVLVHGAWHGSWCWKRVRRALQEAGHEVFTPTLTGLGERSHLLSPSVTLATHVADVVNLIRWEELDDLILVAHSYGGFVSRHVADAVADRLRHIVYLDAFVPDNGRTLNSYSPEAAEIFRQGAAASGDGWKIPPASSGFFDVNAGDAAWMDAQCTPQPLSTFDTPAAYGNAADAVPTTYVLADGFVQSPFPPFAQAAAKRGWPTHGLPGGHDLMLDCPDEVTSILLRLT